MTGLESPLHIAMLLVVVLLVFGAKRLPEMGKSMGEGMRGFKDAISGEHSSPGHELTAAVARLDETSPRAAERPAGPVA